jgi:predicted transport protein
MSDIKLFRIAGGMVTELMGSSVALEKSLQNLMEQHLESFLGVRILASEYSTGKTHAGRIDTLGLDENNCPVIIEYKRSLNENVVNQGLFYLDWLLDHRAEFTLHCMKVLGPEIQDQVDWTAPRLICIAGDFTKYDEQAVAQINRNIELVRYRRYGDEFMVFELVNAATGTPIETTGAGPGLVVKPKTSSDKTVSEYLDQSPTDLRDLYQAFEDFALALGDDVTRKALKLYFAFRRIKNFACVEVHPQAKKLLVFAKVNPDEVELVNGFTRDVSKIGHFGTGDLEITLRSLDDFERAKPLIVASYEVS